MPAARSGVAPALNQESGPKTLTQLRQEVSFPIFVPGLVPTGWRAGTPWRSSESSPIIHISYADTDGKPALLVSNGPAGSGLDAVPGKTGKSVLIREMITAHYLPNQPEFGGPILWWDEAGAYVAISGRYLTEDTLHVIANSMSAVVPLESPGWRVTVTTNAELRLTSVSPEGNDFLLTTNVLGDRSHDLWVTVGATIVTAAPKHLPVVFATPDHWHADIVEVPWGKVVLEAGSDRGHEGGGVLSPDLRYAAVPLAEGLWLGDVLTGEGHIITAPPPEQWPEGLVGPQNPLQWVTQPRWSPDSKWIYFQSNRTKPHTLTWWRVAVTGGPEEPVAGEVLTDDRPVVCGITSRPSILDRIRQDGFFFRDFSPDGLWAAADKIDSPTFRLYNLKHPETTVTYEGPSGYYASTGYRSWSPDSSKVFFHVRAAGKPTPTIGVLDLKPGGTTRFYAFPDPDAGQPHALGFVGNDHLLVAVHAWNPTKTEAQQGGSTQLWLLDLNTAATAAAAATP